jgi:hypothetical protein
VAGAAVGGATVTLLGVRPSLLIDSVTFVVSGLLIGLGTRARPAVAGPGASPGSPLRRAAAGLRLVFGDRALRTLVLLGWLVVFYTIPQGIAAPYAARLGGGPVATGLVLASTAAATAIATPLFSRFVSPRRRLALMGPLAMATCAILVLTALRPGLAVSLVIFSAAAAAGTYQLAVNTAFVVRVPDERRAQAFGIASMGVVVAQGAAFVGAGAAAEVVTPESVVAVGGGIGAVAAFALTLSWRRVSSPPRPPRPARGCPALGELGHSRSGDVVVNGRPLLAPAARERHRHRNRAGLAFMNPVHPAGRTSLGRGRHLVPAADPCRPASRATWRASRSGRTGGHPAGYRSRPSPSG